MILELALVSAGGLVLALGVYQARMAWLSSRARHRLRGQFAAEAPAGAQTSRSRASSRKETRIRTEASPAHGVGAAVVAALALVFAGVPFPYATAVGAVAGAIVHVMLASRAQSIALTSEEALCEAISLIRAALRAGSSPAQSIERAAREVGGNCGRALDAAIARIRLGDTPTRALEGLVETLPFDSVRHFAVAMGVQWSAGGSLERSLDAVARASRDRVSVARRVHSQSAPTRASAFVLVLANAAVAALSWSHDPVNLEMFLASSSGTVLVAGSLWLQAGMLLAMRRMLRDVIG